MSMDQPGGLPRRFLPDVRSLMRQPMSIDNFTPSHPVDRGARTARVPFDQMIEAAGFIIFHENFDIWFCTGNALDYNGNPVYAELHYRRDHRSSSHAPFIHNVKLLLKAMHKDKAIAYAYDLIDQVQRCNSVYVPADYAHPRSRFLDGLIVNKQQFKAFIVALHGYRNPAPCSCCQRNFASNINQNRIHVMSPFFGCYSLLDAFGGKCANCLFHTYANCEYERVDYRPRNTLEESTAGNLFTGRHVQFAEAVHHPEPLRLQTAPRVTNEWPINWHEDTHATQSQLDQFVEELALGVDTRVPHRSWVQRKLLETSPPLTPRVFSTPRRERYRSQSPGIAISPSSPLYIRKKKPSSDLSPSRPQSTTPKAGSPAYLRKQTSISPSPVARPKLRGLGSKPLPVHAYDQLSGEESQQSQESDFASQAGTLFRSTGFQKEDSDTPWEGIGDPVPDWRSDARSFHLRNKESSSSFEGFDFPRPGLTQPFSGQLPPVLPSEALSRRSWKLPTTVLPSIDDMMSKSPARPIDQVQGVVLPPVVLPQGFQVADRRPLTSPASPRQDTTQVRSPSKLRTPSRGFKAINVPVGKDSVGNPDIYAYDNTIADFMDQNPAPVFRLKRDRADTEESEEN